MFRVISISIVFVIWLCPVFSQDLTADLTKITGKVDSSDFVSLVVGVKVYSGKGGKITYSTKSEMYKSTTAKLTILDNQEFYSSPKEEIVVDNEDQMIVVKRKSESSGKTGPAADKNSADKSMKEIIKLLEKSEGKGPKPVIKCTSTSSAARVYKVTNLPTMKEMIITLNMDELKLISVTYEYLEESEYKGQYIVLNYQTFSTAAEEASKKLKSSNYYTLVNDKVQVAAKYANYKIYAE